MQMRIQADLVVRVLAIHDFVGTEVLLSARFSVAKEYAAAFTTISETNQPLLLTLAIEVGNWVYMENSASWIDLEQVCGQVFIASNTVF